MNFKRTVERTLQSSRWEMIMGWEKISAEREDSEESLVDKLLSTFTDKNVDAIKGGTNTCVQAPRSGVQ